MICAMRCVRENAKAVCRSGSDQDRLVAVEAVHDPAAYMLGKKCLENNLSPASSDAADPAFDLKTFATGASGVQQDGV